jgi:hypothetical protein
VLQRRVSTGDSTSCPWNSMEAEIPLDAWVTLVVYDYWCHGGLLVSYDSAIGPLAQSRDAAQLEEEEEHADYNLRKVSPIKRRKMGLSSSTKMGFFRLRTDFYLAKCMCILPGPPTRCTWILTCWSVQYQTPTYECSDDVVMMWWTCHLISQ